MGLKIHSKRIISPSTPSSGLFPRDYYSRYYWGISPRWKYEPISATGGIYQEDGIFFDIRGRERQD